jgi:adenosylcobinamide-GDP ribazoletransferase
MTFFGKLWLRLLGAFQFLTVIPIQRSTAPVHESAPFFPLAGAFIGIASSLPILLLPLPAGLEAALALAVQLVITGMLHEDGLADIADALRAGRTREKMFEIIKDSRIGSYGASALIAALILRWQGLTILAASQRTSLQILSLLAASEALSRCAILWLAHVTPPAREGMGAWLSEGKSAVTLIASIAQALFFASLAGVEQGLWLIVGLLPLVVLARLYFVKRLGGVVGDCFGAFQQAAVIYCLLVCAWPRSS